MWEYEGILELYDRCALVAMGPVLQGNLQKFVVFLRLYVLFVEAHTSNMPSFDMNYAYPKNYIF